VLLSDIKDSENAARVAQKILEAFVTPINLCGELLMATTSIGIALCPDDAGDPETLLRLADQAMYQAKAAGRNNYRFHEKGSP
jgi:diguanylate cyclase (GGDEF)-like protein